MDVRGGVADQLERVAAALEAGLIVVGKSARSRMYIARSVGRRRRLLGATGHIVVV